jgi:hypothetical protein
MVPKIGLIWCIFRIDKILKLGGHFMKGMLSAIFGALLIWVIFGLTTNDWSPVSLLTFIIGIVIGHGIGKKDNATN